MNPHSNNNKRDLLNLKEKLEDVKLEKEATFDQTGLHVWSNKVTRQFQEYEEEIHSLEEQIAQKEKNSYRE